MRALILVDFSSVVYVIMFVAGKIRSIRSVVGTYIVWPAPLILMIVFSCSFDCILSRCDLPLKNFAFLSLVVDHMSSLPRYPSFTLALRRSRVLLLIRGYVARTLGTSSLHGVRSVSFLLS